MTTAATMPMPPMVGVPALAMWTWGPSSRICWPMLFLISHRMSTGVDRTATHRATPPDVISEIIAGVPPNRSARARRASTRSSNGTDRPPTVWVVSWPLPATSTTSPGSARPTASRMAAARSGSTTTSAPAPSPGPDLVDDGHGVLGPRVVRGQDDHVGQPRRHRAHLRPLPRVAVAAAPEQRRSRGRRRPGRGPRSAPPRGRPGCGRSRRAPRPGSGGHHLHPARAPDRRRPRPSTTWSSSTPRVVATAAATRALSTLNRPVSGRSTLPAPPPERGRARRRSRPRWPRPPRTGTRVGPAELDGQAGRPQGSST